MKNFTRSFVGEVHIGWRYQDDTGKWSRASCTPAGWIDKTTLMPDIGMIVITSFSGMPQRMNRWIINTGKDKPEWSSYGNKVLGWQPQMIEMEDEL